MSIIRHIPHRKVSDADSRVLKKLRYKYPEAATAKGQIVSSTTIETPLQSLSLGALHTISSGGRQFWIRNREYNIDYWPVLGGVPSPDGVLSGGLPTPPYARIYEDEVTIDENCAGGVDYTSEVEFECQHTYLFNRSVEAISFIPSQDYTGYLTLKSFYLKEGIPYRLVLNDTKFFKSPINPLIGGEEALEADVEFVWWFKTPFDNKEGEILHYEMSTEIPNQLFMVRGCLTDPTMPWKKKWFRHFRETPVAVGQEFVTSDRKVYESASFIVDSDAGSFTFTVEESCTRFVIADGMSNFHVNEQTVVIGDASYTLDKKDNEYIFIKTPSGWRIYSRSFQDVI